jgi:cytochrome c biogenesis protein CcmG/thiol:disulfide interchange protein DsbE
MTTSSTSTTPKPSLRWGWLIAGLGIVALLVLVGVQLFTVQAGGLLAGQPAPDFTVTGFPNTPLAGKQFRLSEARGQVVLLNFWASWCAPCRVEAPDLEAIWQRYKDRGVVVVGLAWSDTERESLKFINEFNQTYLNGPDLGTRAGQAYRIRAVPETYLIDQNGVLVWFKKGPTDLAEMQQQIEPLLTR